MHKLIRITTIPLSLEKLLEGQLTYMGEFYEVIAVSAEEERLKQFGRDNNVRTYWVEMTRAITPLKDLKAVWKLYKFLAHEKPLIVHTHTPKAGIIGMLAAKMAGVPFRLHTVAGLPLLETSGTKRRVLNAVEKITYQLATKIYPNSIGLKEIILKENFTTEGKLKVLGKGSSNGIDTAYFNPELYTGDNKIELKQNLGISINNLVFIFIGRLVSEKGINELVSAFIALQTKHHHLTLLLVGPYEEDLDPLEAHTLQSIKKNSQIISTGYQQDIRPYLAISDVLVFPSYREGFPNVVLQAGAMGIPSIVSNINGCNEIIKPGVNGVIIPVKDQKALYFSMQDFIKNPGIIKMLSERAREEICANYNRQTFWKLLKNEYQNLKQTADIDVED